MKNITTTILLVLLSLLSYSQEYYRDTTIERAVFNEVNRHRDSLGLHMVKFNSDNILASPWAETLTKHDLETGGKIYHCGCNPGIEIIAIKVIGDEDRVTMGVDVIAKKIVLAWDNSPSHKEGMEDINMKRGFNAVYVFKSKRYGGKYVALSVYQFIRDKEYYVNLDWDENKKVPNQFLH
jgi:hypothetical protein